MTGPTGVTSVSWGSLKKTAEDATKPLPVDWYDVTVVKAEAKVASTGSNMVSATLEVDSGPSKTRRLFTNFVLTPDNGFALGIFFRNMAAFGLDDRFFAELSQYPIEQGMDIIAQQLQGRQVRVKVGIRQWQGQDRNECQEFAPLSDAGPTAPGMVTGPARVSAGPVAPGGPTAPTSPAAPSSPTAPLSPTSAPTTPTTPAVPGPPPPPQPAF